MSSEPQQKPYFPARVQVACSEFTPGNLRLRRSLDTSTVYWLGFDSVRELARRDAG